MIPKQSVSLPCLFSKNLFASVSVLKGNPLGNLMWVPAMPSTRLLHMRLSAYRARESDILNQCLDFSETRFQRTNNSIAGRTVDVGLYEQVSTILGMAN